MIGVNVRFEYDGTFDRSRVIDVAEHARSMFEGMPGLRFKFFTFDEEQQSATNFYVWDSKIAALEFFSDDLRQEGDRALRRWANHRVRRDRAGSGQLRGASAVMAKRE